MANRRSISLVIVLLTLFFSVGRVFAATVAPTGPAPDGSVAVPITTSSSAQTKAGTLQTLGPTTVEGTLTVGKTAGTSRVCWNSDCRTSWDDVLHVTGYLHLQSNSGAPDAGRFVVQGSSVPTNPISAIHVVAGAASLAFPTFGLYGTAEVNTAAGQSTAKSIGVFGQAAVNSSLHSAIYATARPSGTDLLNAWAGYFFGDVAIGDTNEAGGYDLVVGSGAPNNNGIAELCLNGVCQSSWPAGTGGGLWALATSGPLNYQKSNDATRSLGIGGNGAAAGMQVSVASSFGTPTGATMTIDGPAKYDRYVVGTPSNLTVGQTCGDGVCNNSENDTFGSGNYCPVDCDVTAPQQSYIDDSIPVQSCQHGVPCDTVSPYIYLRIFTPPDSDVTGVRVIIRTDRFAEVPFDQSGSGLQIYNVAIGPNGSTLLQPPCSLSATYFTTLFTYDRGGNYSSAAYTYPSCINIPPV